VSGVTLAHEGETAAGGLGAGANCAWAPIVPAHKTSAATSAKFKVWPEERMSVRILWWASWTAEFADGIRGAVLHPVTNDCKRARMGEQLHWVASVIYLLPKGNKSLQ